MAEIFRWEEYTERVDNVQIPVGIAEDGSILREKLLRSDLEAWANEGIPCDVSPEALQQIISEWLEGIWPAENESE